VTTRSLLWGTCALLLTAGTINSCTIARAECKSSDDWCLIERGVLPGIHEITPLPLARPKARVMKARVEYGDNDCDEITDSGECIKYKSAPPPRFKPWQLVWQCNDIRVTVTSRKSDQIEYDLGGSIWGGSRFNIIRGALFFNGRPCAPIARWP
jgi:hypothetical protein